MSFVGEINKEQNGKDGGERDHGDVEGGTGTTQRILLDGQGERER